MRDYKIGETFTIGQKELIVVKSPDSVCNLCVLQEICNKIAKSTFTSMFGNCDCDSRDDKTYIHFQWKEGTL